MSFYRLDDDRIQDDLDRDLPPRRGYFDRGPDVTVKPPSPPAVSGADSRPLCEDCADDGEQVPAVHEWDRTGPGSGGLHLCDRHADRRQDAHEPDPNGVSAAERNAAAYDAYYRQRGK